MGDVVLAELLKDRGLVDSRRSTVDVFVAGVTPEDEPAVLALAHECRDAGLGTEYAMGGQSLGKQFKLADARGAAWVAVIGPDDRARGDVMVKDLTGGTQRSVVRGEVVRALAIACGRA
jgi:histidyl-tRNA synthetase